MLEWNWLFIMFIIMTFAIMFAFTFIMIMFIIIGILSAIVFFLMRDKDEAELHKLIKRQEKEYKAKLKAEKAQGGK